VSDPQGRVCVALDSTFTFTIPLAEVYIDDGPCTYRPVCPGGIVGLVLRGSGLPNYLNSPESPFLSIGGNTTIIYRGLEIRGMPCQSDIDCGNPGVYDTKTAAYGYLSLCADCVDVHAEKHPNSFCVIAGPELLPEDEQEELAADLGMTVEEMTLE